LHLNLKWQEEKRRAHFEILSPRVPTVKPRALCPTNCGKEFRTQAGTHLNGPVVPIWRFTDGGSQSASLRIFGGLRYSVDQWSIHRCDPVELISIFIKGWQGRGYTHYLRGQSQRGTSSQRPSLPNFSHLARRRA